MTVVQRDDNFTLPLVLNQDFDMQVSFQAPRVDGQGVVQRDPVTNAITYDPMDTTDWDVLLQIAVRVGGTIVVEITVDPAGVDGFLSVQPGMVVVKLYSTAIDRLKSGMPYDFFVIVQGVPKRYLHGVVHVDRTVVV